MRFAALMTLFVSFSAHAKLTVFTDRPMARFQKAAQIFQAETGQTATFFEAGYDGLLKTLERDGAASEADVIIVKDIVYLAQLKSKGHLQSMKPSAALRRVHSHMRDPQNAWVGLTFRARTAVYNPHAGLSASDFTTYEDLASPKWKGRLCLRTSKGSYNEALTGFLLATTGSQKAKSTVSGWVANLALPVFGNDTAAMEAMARGECDAAIVNHYYFAGLLAKNPNFPGKIAFLNQNGKGVHTNGAGMGIVKVSKQAALAQKFIEILLRDEIQIEVSAAHFDFPVVKGLAPTTHIRNWGTFKMDPTPWSQVGAQAAGARALMNQAGYN